MTVVADLDVGVPQLKFPSPLRLPAAVQKDQQVGPAVPPAVFEIIEIDMDVEMPAGRRLVHSPADKPLVGQKRGNPQRV